jgi:hypothetical protein
MRCLLPLAAALTLPVVASAQCFESNLGASIGVGDDSILAVTPMNITFPMGGIAATYTHIQPTTNGLAYLTNGVGAVGATGTGYSGTAATMVTNLRGLAGQNPRIAAYWRDLNILAANSGGVFVNNTIAGKCVVTWKNAVHFGQTTPIFTVQAQLYSDGHVDMFYSGTTQDTAVTPICGISAGNAIADPGVSDLSVSSIGVSTSQIVYQTFAALNTFDLQNTTVSFRPNGGGGFDVIPSPCVPAFHSPYGSGCYTVSGTWYESFAAGAMDLSSTAIHMTPTGSGYVMTVGAPTAFVHSVPGLSLTDDSVGTLALPSAFAYPGGSTSSISICSNGYIWMQTPNALADFSPTVAELFSSPSRLCPCWVDLLPDGATNVNNVFAEVDVPNNKAYVTWVGVPTFTAGGVANMQVELNLTTGDVNYTYGTMTLPAVAIVGWAPGTGLSTIDPGNRDVSATIAAGFTTGTPEILGVALSAAPPPVLGATVTYTLSNIRPSLSISAMFFSFGQTGAVPLSAVGFNSPGCFSYLDTSPSLGYGAVSTLLLTNPTATMNVTVPNLGIWAGVDIYLQGATLAPAESPSGVLTSNGMRSRINSF